MSDWRQFEYRVLRYVPDPEQPETGADIGVIVVELAPSDQAFVGIQLTQDWKLARTLNPDFEPEYLLEFEDDVRQDLQSLELTRSRQGKAVSARDWILNLCDQGLSTTVQCTKPSAIAAVNGEKLLRNLTNQFCQRHVEDSAPRAATTGRTYLKARMEEQLLLVGATPKLVHRNFAVSTFLPSVKRMNVDFVYEFKKPGSEKSQMKLFHAVSLQNDPNAGELMSYRWQALREGILKAGYEDTAMTAIVEDHPEKHVHGNDVIKDMRDRDITVRSVSEAPQIAMEAKTDLRL